MKKKKKIFRIKEEEDHTETFKKEIKEIDEYILREFERTLNLHSENKNKNDEIQSDVLIEEFERKRNLLIENYINNSLENAFKGLVEKGIFEVFEKDGKKYYRMKRF